MSGTETVLINYTASAFCCTCNVICMHVGPHSYCNEHGSKKDYIAIPSPVVVPSYPIDRQQEIIDLLKQILEEVRK